MSTARNSESNRHAATEQQSRRREAAHAANEAVFAAIDDRAAQQFFAKRGLSADTIRALILHEVEMPEELLLLSDRELLQIDGLEKNGLAEVKAYRRRFSGKNE